MNWAVDLFTEDGRDLGRQYCTSRAEARERARFYRTMTDGRNRVARTRIIKL